MLHGAAPTLDELVDVLKALADPVRLDCSGASRLSTRWPVPTWSRNPTCLPPPSRITSKR